MEVNMVKRKRQRSESFGTGLNYLFRVLNEDLKRKVFCFVGTYEIDIGVEASVSNRNADLFGKYSDLSRILTSLSIILDPLLQVSITIASNQAEKLLYISEQLRGQFPKSVYLTLTYGKCAEENVPKSLLAKAWLTKLYLPDYINYFSDEQADFHCILDDLVDNHTLRELVVEASTLQTGIDSIAQMLTNNLSLKKLRLRYEHIEYVTLKNCKLSNLDLLDLTGSLIGNPGVQIIASVLSEPNQLRTLILEENDIDWDGAVLLAHSLTFINSCCKLKWLNLDNNNIGLMGAQCILESLRKNETLHSLHLSYNNIIGNRTITPHSFEFLSVNTTLNRFHIGGNKIEFLLGPYICPRLECNKSNLRSMNLGVAEIGDSGAESISKVIRCSETLDILKLHSNLIGDVGVRHISEALAVNKSLRELNLGFNRIQDNGFVYLANALKENRKLLVLVLENNGLIKCTGATAISESLKVNHTLKSLDLTYSRAGPVNIGIILDGLKTNSNLHTLLLKGNELGDEGAKSIAEYLVSNPKLSQLGLRDNLVSSVGTRLIFDALKVNRRLRHLSVDNFPAIVNRYFIRCLVNDHEPARYKDLIRKDWDLTPLLNELPTIY